MTAHGFLNGTIICIMMCCLDMLPDITGYYHIVVVLDASGGILWARAESNCTVNTAYCTIPQFAFSLMPGAISDFSFYPTIIRENTSPPHFSTFNDWPLTPLFRKLCAKISC